MSTTVDDKDGRTISFKHSVSLDGLGKALKGFGNAYKILSGREAKYTDFTDWLATQDFVEVSPSLKDVEEAVPFLAVGNSEPIPEHLPEKLKEVIREGRREAGWCDHGNKPGDCPEGCK
jgi:hypothetical protein